jgi:hypothetical protein
LRQIYYNKLLEADIEGKCRTALECLQFFMDLATVFLQDAAAVMLLHPV